jgi:hypothetical protein
LGNPPGCKTGASEQRPTVNEGSGSFLKKRTKKLLALQASTSPDRHSPNSQKFFASFFQKRRAFLP